MVNSNWIHGFFETSLQRRECDAVVMFTGKSAAQSKLLSRGYQLEVSRAPSGWRVGIYPRKADLPILGRCEVVALNHHEAVLMAKDRVDGVMSL